MYKLLHNAISYTEQGYIKIASEKRNGSALLTIEDTGIGISDKNKERIFDSFFVVDKSRSRHYGASTGLGLSIVKHIVDMHDGNITIESEEEKGSKFFIYLPLYVLI